MRPASPALVAEIFRTMRQRAQPDSRVDAVVEFRITGRRDGGIDRYQLALVDGRGRRPAGTRCTESPSALTLELEPVAFLRLVGGTASAKRLLIAGKLKVHGDVILALALPRRSGFPGAAHERQASTEVLLAPMRQRSPAQLGDALSDVVDRGLGERSRAERSTRRLLPAIS